MISLIVIWYSFVVAFPLISFYNSVASHYRGWTYNFSESGYSFKRFIHFYLVKTINSALNNWIVASYCDCIFVGVNPSIVC